MGFLDHSTNNIIVDAVLTDTGRKFLARNDGSFSVVKFALADDEINYDIIKQFGRTVGKEKIEKNTPVFEAFTNDNLGQKYRMVSISNDNLIRLPTFSVTSDSSGTGTAGATTVALGRNTTKSATISLTQTITNESSIDVELRDQAFIVKVPNLFYQIAGTTPDNIDNQQIATYILTRDAGETSVGGSKLTFTIQVKSLTDEHFTVYGLSSDKTLIRRYVTITGVQSGAVFAVEVQVDKDN